MKTITFLGFSFASFSMLFSCAGPKKNSSCIASVANVKNIEQSFGGYLFSSKKYLLPSGNLESSEQEIVDLSKSEDSHCTAQFQLIKKGDEFQVVANTTLDSRCSDLSQRFDMKAAFYSPKKGYQIFELNHQALGQRDKVMASLTKEKYIPVNDFVLSPFNAVFVLDEWPDEEKKLNPIYCKSGCDSGLGLWTEIFEFKKLSTVQKNFLQETYEAQQKQETELEKKLGKSYSLVAKIREVRLQRSQLEKELNFATSAWILSECNNEKFNDVRNAFGHKFSSHRINFCKESRLEIYTEGLKVLTLNGKNPFQVASANGKTPKLAREALYQKMIAAIAEETKLTLELSKVAPSKLLSVSSNFSPGVFVENGNGMFGFVKVSKIEKFTTKGTKITYVDGKVTVEKPAVNFDKLAKMENLMHPMQQGTTLSLMGVFNLALYPVNPQHSHAMTMLPLPSYREKPKAKPVVAEKTEAAPARIENTNSSQPSKEVRNPQEPNKTYQPPVVVEKAPPQAPQSTSPSQPSPPVAADSVQTESKQVEKQQSSEASSESGSEAQKPSQEDFQSTREIDPPQDVPAETAHISAENC